MEKLSTLQKMSKIFDATPDSNTASQRDLDNPSDTEAWIHNLACFFAEDKEEWYRFCSYVEALMKDGDI